MGAAEVAAALAGLPAWQGDEHGISRSRRFPSMLAAAEAVVEIAAEADEMDHHPDVDLRYRTMHVGLTTHDVGGVTELDLRLAREIDRVLGEDQGPRALDRTDEQRTRARRPPAQPGSGA
ncbi:4a-hydroxytetrahydrobiopterin dehydratase [Modestobacter sp. I12A-02628]|uniref:Putative pterin-4-alpha-carbinolamine dehydratase n=1 Tax=Goekera deserti TaxID=2497753 RepID=A0A7K3WCN7_9ACTN|nr:4a-hydroxytetrahydrobiopterin dehydratase [Goekera deserti]MPQ98558.1 4a-hydroxytetrahydrobiopterin dehydratase [Goekera deserti]NDI49072.1 4a-hydroxytetrahydrobiopterin dehydratase [Goekera deserti]NEL54137.1 4a-hydroxytetrahydrobiopterin dehydratase [Goekera deserti]